MPGYPVFKINGKPVQHCFPVL